MIEVVAPGMLTTIQDLGREGFGPFGVSASGAADVLALRLGNRLLGNTDCSPALEMTILGGAFRFPQGATIAITGSDFGASVAMWRTIVVAPGDTVKFGHTKAGARCYLCVAGGIDAPMWLGSASAHLHSGMGGGALKKGDTLAIAPVHAVRPARTTPPKDDRTNIRVTASLQGDGLDGIYKVTEEANRLGIRLEGATVTPRVTSILSEGAPLGAIQVTPSGQLIILGVEQQTAGGYPKIANVIAADLYKLGQIRPRDEIRFSTVSIERARTLLLKQEAWLNDAVHANP